MRREARLGDRVILYDEGGHWRGLGTAWALAEQGKRVTIVTPEAYVGKELTRTAADQSLRARLARLGVRSLTEHVIEAWQGDAARVLSLLTGETQTLPASGLILSTTNRAFDPLSADLQGIETHLIGDAASPRLAPYAFHDGRKVGLVL
jgi:NADPH-dependent 2,4-dienoyl-CoA reductase/sulfur reductase-like enzyme